MTSSSSYPLPKSGVAGFVENWRNDLLAGFLVFLIALPLCLGIAMASGFPPMAGIISAIIGGLVVSRISGSYVTINGPAAGLIVVIVDAVQSLGQGDAMAGYRYTLAAIVVASVLQILLGIFKAGKLSVFFPSSVVHGMLAAIGLIIMTKQIHTLLGVKPEAKTIIGSLLEIPHSIMELNPEVASIGLMGLGILILWAIVKNPVLKMVPAPLLVVLLGVGLGQYFDLDHIHQYLFLPNAEILPHHQFTIGPTFLVAVPENFMDGFYFPDFGKIATSEFWQAVVTIWLVGSLESLLSATAVDKLDPYKRLSNLNRDLTAVGVGNLFAGLLGGLPMIAEIVRSSANINNGARTGWSNFFHGAFLLFFVALFPNLIHEIPLSALAALLVFTGFRLASPKEFARIFAVGLDNFVVFVSTLIGIIATDLLVGVAIGILIKLVLHLVRGLKLSNMFKMAYELQEAKDGSTHIKILGSAVFSNIITLKSLLADLPTQQTVYFDLADAYLVDHAVMEFIHEFCEDYNHAGGNCKIVGMDALTASSSHPLATRRRAD